MRHRFLLLPLILLPGVAGCLQAKTPKATPAADTAPFVRVTSVQRYGGETVSSRYSASIVPYSQFDLAFKVGGYVQWLAETRGSDGRRRALQGGDRVRRDAALARVRQIDYVTPVLHSQSELEQTQAKRRQADSALREAHASRNQAQAERTSAVANRRQAHSKRAEAEAVLAQAQAGLTKSQAGLGEAQAVLVARQATLAEARLARDRAVALYNGNSMIKPEYDTAIADYERAQAGVSQAEEQIAQLKAQNQQSQSQIQQARSQIQQAQAQIDAADASIRSANAQIQASKARVDAAGAQVNEAAAGVSGARAQLTQNRVPLGDTTLTVPADALIIKRLVEVGALVKPGDPAFTLANISQVKAVFGVPDIRLSSVRLGSPVSVTADSRPGRRFRGQVTAIAPSADPKSRVFQVEVTIPNPDRQLEAGLIVTAEFDGHTVGESSLVVPMQAIIGQPGEQAGYAVYVTEGSGENATARLRRVELGTVYGDQIEVTSGVRTGEQVVVSGPGLLHDGQKVRIDPSSAQEQ
jgi:multidrug efflux system membrane fusion protein